MFKNIIKRENTNIYFDIKILFAQLFFCIDSKNYTTLFVDRFSGNLCENDIDDCEFTSGFNPCNNGSCHDLVGGYTCLCPSYSGFTGST